MSWREAVAQATQAESDLLLDAISAAVAAEFDLPADQVRAVAQQVTQPAVDNIVAELMAGHKKETRDVPHH